MPLPIMLAHKLVRKLADVRKSGELSYLGPDGKSQVSVEYLDGRAVRVDNVVLSTQHGPEILDKTGNMITEKARKEIIDVIIRPVLGKRLIDDKTKFLVNPTGKFVVGGPASDTGLTGRKIIVDTYGGRAPHGGGAFSGKDPTKVDRSGAYACRYLAKNVVAAGLADKCTIQIGYAIGVSHPLSFYVDLHGGNNVDPARLEAILPQMIGGATPRAIREHLKLNRPIYARTTAYGHFGREPDADGGFSWEKTDLAEELRRAF
jgi:S-adenosylmethionine synthetase